jgi:biotin carboxylase
MSTGQNLIRELVALHTARPHRLRDFMASRGAATQHLVSQADGVVTAVHGLDVARRVPGVTDVNVWISPGDTAAPARDNTGYIGEVIAIGENSAQAASRAAAAAREVLLLLA